MNFSELIPHLQQAKESGRMIWVQVEYDDPLPQRIHTVTISYGVKDRSNPRWWVMSEDGLLHVSIAFQAMIEGKFRIIDHTTGEVLVA